MSEAVKHYKELENQIFREYYYSNFISSTVGGSPNTAIMHLLQSIQAIMNTTVSANEINRNWIGDVSWFTERLEDLFQLPRFRDESDREYYDRLLDLVDAHQDEDTIKTAINTLIQDAIASESKITFAFQTAQGNWGDDAVPATYSFFWNNTPSDVWGDANVSLRAVMKIIIEFANNLQDGLIAHYRLDGDVRDTSSSIETIDTSVDNITFVEGSPDTIDRSSGDWTMILEAGQNITLDGSDENDSRFQIASLTSSTLTLTSDNQLENETMSSGTLTLDIEHNRHGTNNGVTFDYVKWNYGGFFDGSSWIETSLIDNILFTDKDWTLSFTINPSTLGSITGNACNDDRALIIGREQVGGNYADIHLESDGTLVLASDGITRTLTTLQTDTEYDIIVTHDSSTGTVKCYVDGVEVSSRTDYVFTPTGSPIFIGGGLSIGCGGDARFHGSLDNIMIWEKVITSTERDLLEDYKTTYEYWSAPMNYTKIVQLIDLYRPPGIDFELELNY